MIVINNDCLFQMDDGDTERNTASFHVFGKPNWSAETFASFFGEVENGGDGIVRSTSSEL